MDMLRRFYEEEEGLTTVEMVVLLAVLVSIALIFRTAIVKFVQDSIASIFGSANVSVQTQ